DRRRERRAATRFIATFFALFQAVHVNTARQHADEQKEDCDLERSRDHGLCSILSREFAIAAATAAAMACWYLVTLRDSGFDSTEGGAISSATAGAAMAFSGRSGALALPEVILVLANSRTRFAATSWLRAR